MKKYVAILLSAVMLLGSTGCSQIEKQHFDSLMCTDIVGTGTFKQSLCLKIDADVMGNAVIDISKLMPEPEYEEYPYYGEEDTEEDILQYEEAEEDFADDDTVKEDFQAEDNGNEEAPYYFDEEYEEEYDGEYDFEYMPDTELFVNMFLQETRIALDENRDFVLTINSEGSYDMDKCYADQNLTCKLGNITMDCGSVYTRDNGIYISKKYFYTIGALNFMQDSQLLAEYFAGMDKLFDGRQYAFMSMEGTNMGDSGMDKANAVLKNTGMPAFRDRELQIYENCKDLFKDYESGKVTKTEKGTKFELKDDEFADFVNRLTDYVGDNATQSVDIVNDYLDIIFGITQAAYGTNEEESENTNEEAADTNEEITDGEELEEYDFNALALMPFSALITEDDLNESLEGIKEGVNSPEYAVICDNMDISYTGEVREEKGIKKITDVITADYKGGNALEYTVEKEYDRLGTAVFDEIDEKDSVDYLDTYNVMMNVINDWYGFGDDSGYNYDFSFDKEYPCSKCGGTYHYAYTEYCEDCGIVHDFYDYDEECGLQHGCLIVNGIEALPDTAAKA